MFTRLPLDMPSRGLPNAKPRHRQGTHPGEIVRHWADQERKVWPAICALRDKGCVVWRVSDSVHEVDGEQITTTQLIALSRALPGESNGQSPQEDQHEEKGKVGAQPAVPR